MPAVRMRASASGASAFRLWRSILRRCPKAAAVTFSRSARLAGAAGSASGSNRTTLEVIFGGGTKALRAEDLSVKDFARLALTFERSQAGRP